MKIIHTKVRNFYNSHKLVRCTQIFSDFSRTVILYVGKAARSQDLIVGSSDLPVEV